jgi:hypothetical protein
MQRMAPGYVHTIVRELRGTVAAATAELLQVRPG